MYLTDQSTTVRIAAGDDFKTLFDAAYARLDRGYNTVHIADLRAALPQFSHEQFDANIHELRLEGDYSMSAAEADSRWEEGIPDGELSLVHVMKR